MYCYAVHCCCAVIFVLVVLPSSTYGAGTWHAYSAYMFTPCMTFLIYNTTKAVPFCCCCKSFRCIDDLLAFYYRYEQEHTLRVIHLAQKKTSTLLTLVGPVDESKYRV